MHAFPHVVLHTYIDTRYILYSHTLGRRNRNTQYIDRQLCLPRVNAHYVRVNRSIEILSQLIGLVQWNYLVNRVLQTCELVLLLVTDNDLIIARNIFFRLSFVHTLFQKRKRKKIKKIIHSFSNEMLRLEFSMLFPSFLIPY